MVVEGVLLFTLTLGSRRLSGLPSVLGVYVPSGDAEGLARLRHAGDDRPLAGTVLRLLFIGHDNL
ncbi:hypothetical protein [Streptomyces sp. NPDC002758]